MKYLSFLSKTIKKDIKQDILPPVRNIQIPTIDCRRNFAFIEIEKEILR